MPLEGPLTGKAVTGRTVGADAESNTIDPAEDAYGVSTKLKYDPNLNPPFVVYTSAPE